MIDLQRVVFAVLAGTFLPSLHAGQELAKESKEFKQTEQVREWFPDDPASLVTLGAEFSSGLNSLYLDSNTGIWASQSRETFVFLNSRNTWADNHQTIGSLGLAVRQLLPDHNVIVGLNAYWDSLHGQGGSEFNQLGLGAEVLTKWVDARFNAYLPEDTQTQIRKHTWESYDDRGVRTRVFEEREAALRGFNTEIGFLVPGLCKYTEVRVFGGYYHYENPFGSDFEGFKARLEARLLPGVIADVEYWDDTALMGGHWTAGVSVSVPFSIFNLVKGRNPFEGAGEMFTPREREFKERMSDMVERSHRVQTVTSGSRLTEDHYEGLKSANGLGGFGGGGAGGFLPIE